MKNLPGKAMLVLAILFLFPSCEENEIIGDSSVNSESHNTGQDCTSCHDFTVAGSIFKSGVGNYSNATVLFSTDENGSGTIVKSLKTDVDGNFYTSKPLNFGTGLYVSVEGSNGTVLHKNFAITNGACNSCHGNSTEAIRLD